MRTGRHPIVWIKENATWIARSSTDDLVLKLDVKPKRAAVIRSKARIHLGWSTAREPIYNKSIQKIRLSSKKNANIKNYTIINLPAYWAEKRLEIEEEKIKQPHATNFKIISLSRSDQHK